MKGHFYFTLLVYSYFIFIWTINVTNIIESVKVSVCFFKVILCCKHGSWCHFKNIKEIVLLFSHLPLLCSHSKKKISLNVSAVI